MKPFNWNFVIGYIQVADVEKDDVHHNQVVSRMPITGAGNESTLSSIVIIRAPEHHVVFHVREMTLDNLN